MLRSSVITSKDPWIKNQWKSFKTPLPAVTGRVSATGDGIATITGLRKLIAGELVRIISNKSVNESIKGMALNLDKHTIGAVIFEENSLVSEGDWVISTGNVMEVPVGPEMIGRVINAIGEAIDESYAKKPIPVKFMDARAIERKAPGIVKRQSVNEAVATGLKVVDVLFPIGRGQRQLILGDRKTGKTTIAIDSIISQRFYNEQRSTEKQVFCVYVAVGQKRSSVVRIVRLLKQTGALSYTIVVAATASEAAALQYIAPFTGVTLGEYFMDSGANALIVYDDLSKHAVAYRQISLLLMRPPGREAYPGDVFYLHARLLERAARLSKGYLGGSLTAFPIIETQAADLTGYIPTNVISITDGQLYLDTRLFRRGVKPSVHTKLSVSRVGSSAQVKSMKTIAGLVKGDLAVASQFAAIEAFDEPIADDIMSIVKRGKILNELLKQKPYTPRIDYEEILILLAGVKGCLDKKELKDLPILENIIINLLQDDPILQYLIPDIRVDLNVDILVDILDYKLILSHTAGDNLIKDIRVEGKSPNWL